jgi:hypothetical protein
MLFVLCISIISIGINSSLSAAATCAGDDSCVIVTDNYMARSNLAIKVALNDVEGVDGSCSKFSSHLTGFCFLSSVLGIIIQYINSIGMEAIGFILITW